MGVGDGVAAGAAGAVVGFDAFLDEPDADFPLSAMIIASFEDTVLPFCKFTTTV